MKTCLKILLAANFLLQISMANKITEYEEDEGSTDREQDHETESNQPSDNKALEYEEDEGKAETVQDHETEESDQTSDNKTPGYEEDEGSPEKVEDHETKGSNQNSDNKTPGYEEDEGSPEKVEDPETEGSNQNSDNKTPGYEEDEGSPETIEDHETEESDQTSDNVIHPSDIVPCDSLSTHNKEVQEEIVNIHNQYRRDVIPSAGNMLKMTWSDKLMKSAWNWANTCNLNHSEVKDRNDDGAPYGENILSSPVCVKWEKTIKQWYNERENLIWGVGPKGNSVVGHYTQIVTDHTYKIGCAMKKCNVKEKIIIFSVCQYYPAGNRPSSLYRPYEKGEPCSHCPKACDESGKFCLNSCKHVDDARNCELAKSVGQCDQYLEVCKATCLCENKIT